MPRGRTTLTRRGQALNVWEYCLKNGARRFVEDACDHDYEIRRLIDFAFVEPESGKDQGLNVRNRAKIIVELMKDKDALQIEREKSKKARERFHGGERSGISSTDMGGGGGRDRDRDDDFYGGRGAAGASRGRRNDDDDDFR